MLCLFTDCVWEQSILLKRVMEERDRITTFLPELHCSHRQSHRVNAGHRWFLLNSNQYVVEVMLLALEICKTERKGPNPKEQQQPPPHTPCCCQKTDCPLLHWGKITFYLFSTVLSLTEYLFLVAMVV